MDSLLRNWPQTRPCGKWISNAELLPESKSGSIDVDGAKASHGKILV